jgi:hypothetical protein
MWRSARSLQLEIGQHRVVIDGIGEAQALQLLAFPCETALNAEQRHHGVGWLRNQLADRGYLYPNGETFTPPAPRLAGELTALSARHGLDAVGILSARACRSVLVQGNGRAGPAVAALLSAAGVGHVHLFERSPARLIHAMPGGIELADEGLPLTEATAAAIRRGAPETDTRLPSLGQRPDLVLLAVDHPVDTDTRDALHARGLPHLRIRLAPGVGSVGPFVVPGLTSCLTCADLYRADRDPAWPAMALQLTAPSRHPTTAEVVVSTTIVGIAAAQALSFLDGGEPASLDGTLEIEPPDWRIRRRSWPAHPECACQAA